MASEASETVSASSEITEAPRLLKLQGEDVLICGCGFLREKDRRDEL